MKLFRTLGVALALAASQLPGMQAAQAAPITFTYSEAESSVNVTGLTLCFGCTLDVSLAPSTTFQLDEIGDSFAFDFINIAIGNTLSGAVSGVVEGTLAFSGPGTGGSGSAISLGGGLWALGIGVGGLSWITQPSNILFSDGSEITLAFSNVYDSCGSFLSRCTLSGSVAASGALVGRAPEPATLALLGLGIVGVGGFARRRKSTAV